MTKTHRYRGLRTTLLATSWSGLLVLCASCSSSSSTPSGGGGSESLSGIGGSGESSTGGAASGGSFTGPGSGGSPSGGASAAGGAGAGAGGVLDGGGGQTDLPAAGGADGSGGESMSGGAASTGGASGDPEVGDATFVPDSSWACGAPGGIIAPERGELVFRVVLDVTSDQEVGLSQYGQRMVRVLGGGSIEGDQIQGNFLEGGLDFELTLSNGSIEYEHVDMLRAADGALVYLRSCGVAPEGQSVVRFVPDFEAGNSGALSWLNSGEFVGTRTVDAALNQIELAIYDVSSAAPSEAEIVISDPAEALNQPWDCLKLSGTQGESIFTEDVLIASSLSVGESKRGTRNVIPITGGTVSGGFTGSVVSAGADYQLLGGTTTLDARYLLRSEDGDVVVVRNCGPFGALIPLFEARADGPHSYLNENRFKSSDPGSAPGGVRITFYELN